MELQDEFREGVEGPPLRDVSCDSTSILNVKDQLRNVRTTLKPSSRFASAAPDMMPWRRYIRLMSGVKRDWHVSRDVRSASTQRISTSD